MKTSVFPGHRMVFTATVTAVSTDSAGCGWVSIDVALSVGDAEADPSSYVIASTCEVRLALPDSLTDNPWSRSGEQWVP